MALVIQVGYGIGDATEESYPRQLPVGRDVNPAIKNEPRGDAVNHCAHERHGGGIGGVGPAEPGDFRGHTPLSPDAMRICERREVVAIEAAGPRPANPLNCFVDVKMMRTKIFAGKNPYRLAHRADSHSRCSSGKCSGVQHRKSGPPAFLLKNLVLEAGAGVAKTRRAGVSLNGIIGKAQLKFFGCAEFDQPVDVLMTVG
jgi:hypothetical protein